MGQGVTVESERQGSTEPWRQGEVGEWYCPYVGAVIGGPLLQAWGKGRTQGQTHSAIDENP